VNIIKKSFFEIFHQIIFLKNQPLTIKLFVFSTILVIIPLMVVGIISYHKSSLELEREEQEYNLQIIEQVKSNIEYYERDFEINILKILNHPDMIALLRMQTPEEVEQSNIRKSIQALLVNTAYSRSDISNISIIIDNIQVIDSAGYKSPYPASNLEKEYWYSSVPANGSSMLISRFIEWPDKKEPVISIVKRIHSPYTLKPIGMIIVDVNFKRIQDISENVNPGKNGRFYILDSEGHYVYCANQSKLGKKADFFNPDMIYSKTENSGVLNVENRDF
jgi:two-component system sensor histidine kinase YesM